MRKPIIPYWVLPFDLKYKGSDFFFLKIIIINLKVKQLVDFEKVPVQEVPKFQFSNF